MESCQKEKGNGEPSGQRNRMLNHKSEATNPLALVQFENLHSNDSPSPDRVNDLGYTQE